MISYVRGVRSRLHGSHVWECGYAAPAGDTPSPPPAYAPPCSLHIPRDDGKILSVHGKKAMQIFAMKSNSLFARKNYDHANLMG